MLEFASSSITIFCISCISCVFVCVCVCVPIRRDGWKICVSQRLFTHSILSTTSSSSKFRYLLHKLLKNCFHRVWHGFRKRRSLLHFSQR